MGTELYFKYLSPIRAFTFPTDLFMLRGKWTFKARCIVLIAFTCGRKKKKSGLCPLHICVMIPYIVFRWPWQIVHGPGLERQHWHHDILEQTKRLSRIMGCRCSHVIREGVVSRSKMGVLFGHDRGGYTTPSGHGRWHWKKKGRALTKAGASESSS